MIGVQIGVQNAAALAEFHRTKSNNNEQNFSIESEAYRTRQIIAERRRMQEPKVAKVGVEGSNPFARSSFVNCRGSFETGAHERSERRQPLSSHGQLKNTPDAVGANAARAYVAAEEVRHARAS